MPYLALKMDQDEYLKSILAIMMCNIMGYTRKIDFAECSDTDFPDAVRKRALADLGKHAD